MSHSQPKNPLHGITLEQIVVSLQERFGWQALGEQIKINCFLKDPSVKSTLKFLRKTPWARSQVEQLYIDTMVEDKNQASDPEQSSDPWANFQSKQ